MVSWCHRGMMPWYRGAPLPFVVDISVPVVVGELLLLWLPPLPLLPVMTLFFLFLLLLLLQPFSAVATVADAAAATAAATTVTVLLRMLLPVLLPLLQQQAAAMVPWCHSVMVPRLPWQCLQYPATMTIISIEEIYLLILILLLSLCGFLIYGL